MRNLEVYEESLMENYLNSNYNYVGVEEKTGEMRICKDIKCSECLLCGMMLKITAFQQTLMRLLIWQLMR